MDNQPNDLDSFSKEYEAQMAALSKLSEAARRRAQKAQEVPVGFMKKVGKGVVAVGGVFSAVSVFAGLALASAATGPLGLVFGIGAVVNGIVGVYGSVKGFKAFDKVVDGMVADPSAVKPTNEELLRKAGLPGFLVRPELTLIRSVIVLGMGIGLAAVVPGVLAVIGGVSFALAGGYNTLKTGKDLFFKPAQPKAPANQNESLVANALEGQRDILAKVSPISAKYGNAAKADAPEAGAAPASAPNLDKKPGGPGA